MFFVMAMLLTSFMIENEKKPISIPSPRHPVPLGGYIGFMDNVAVRGAKVNIFLNSMDKNKANIFKRKCRLNMRGDTKAICLGNH